MAEEHLIDRRAPTDGTRPCDNHTNRLTLLEHSSAATQKVMEAVSTKLDLILAQITKVAILEERHNNQQLDVDRAHGKIERIEKSVETLGIETRAFISYSQGRDKVLWTIAAAVAALFIKVLFFAANNGMTP